MKKSILNEINSLKNKKNNTWINEALFGFSQIEEYLNKLNKNDSVLEVGCGSGILLSLISENFKNLNILGIEPFGQGFDVLKDLNYLSKKNGVFIKNISYEEFETSSKFDLIYCINVFEHVEDWKYFLYKVGNLLNKNGKLIILCPNYAFPYEPHFGIPIIFNKNITYLIFQKYIKNFEKKINSHGLWNSLNFVKKYNIKRHIKNNKNFEKIIFIDHQNIIDFMIMRIIKDKIFKERQKIISYIALFLSKLGLTKIIKIFPNYLPYMKLEFVHKDLNR